MVVEESKPSRSVSPHLRPYLFAKAAKPMWVLWERRGGRAGRDGTPQFMIAPRQGVNERSPLPFIKITLPIDGCGGLVSLLTAPLDLAVTRTQVILRSPVTKGKRERALPCHKSVRRQRQMRCAGDVPGCRRVSFQLQSSTTC
ncbi:unnamed protein product, partial [Iphiclides podalirius]